jgi:GNAT superfamily N-acetyltransferase
VTEAHRKGSQRGEFTIHTDCRPEDVAAVHAFLTRCYWAEGIPLDLVRRSIEHSLPFVVRRGDELVGFARVITDYATFAYVGDVFVLENYRGLGISPWLMEFIAAHPDLQGFRRWTLATRDAHGLYEKSGFAPLADPSIWMERRPVRSYGPSAPASPPASPVPRSSPVPEREPS